MLKSEKSPRRFPTWKTLVLAAIALLLCSTSARGQAPTADIHYNAQTRVFRIDGADVSYIFGVNNKGELQSLYWGQRLSATDNFPAAHANPPWASFDPSTDTTPQEYVAWGGGFYYVPDLKITFPDGGS